MQSSTLCTTCILVTLPALFLGWMCTTVLQCHHHQRATPLYNAFAHNLIIIAQHIDTGLIPFFAELHKPRQHPTHDAFIAINHDCTLHCPAHPHLTRSATSKWSTDRLCTCRTGCAPQNTHTRTRKLGSLRLCLKHIIEDQGKTLADLLHPKPTN